MVASPFMLIGLHRPPRLRAVYAFVISLLGGALLFMAAVPLLVAGQALPGMAAALVVLIAAVWLAFHRRPSRVSAPPEAHR